MQIAECDPQIGDDVRELPVVSTEFPLGDRHRPLIRPPGALGISSAPVEPCQLIVSPRRLEVVGTENALSNLERPFEVLAGLIVLTQVPIDDARFFSYNFV